MEPRTHRLYFQRTHPSGAEEWYCPTCGRRRLVHWPVSYDDPVLEPGDETVTHTGGNRGLWYDHRFVEQPPPSAGLVPAGADPDALLAPWLKLMRERGWAE